MKMDEIICALETADRSELLEKVIEDVCSGYHVMHFRDRQQQWNAMASAIVTMSKDCLLELVLVLYQLYMDKLQLCRKGKEKLTRLQLAWMETMRDVFHLTEYQSDEKESASSFTTDRGVAES